MNAFSKIDSGDIIREYFKERQERIVIIREEVNHFFGNRNIEEIRADTGTVLAGIVGKEGDFAILGADGQSVLGGQRYGIEVRKIFPVDKFTIIGGTGTVSFIQDTVKLYRADINFLQMKDCNFLSPQGKASRLSEIVKQTMFIRSYFFALPIGFALVVYDHQEKRARLFEVGPFGNIDEKYCLGIGSGGMWAFSYLKSRINSKNKRPSDKKDALKLVREAINHAIKNDIFCGGKKIFYLLNSKGIRRIE